MKADRDARAAVAAKAGDCMIARPWLKGKEAAVEVTKSGMLNATSETVDDGEMFPGDGAGLG